MFVGLMFFSLVIYSNTCDFKLSGQILDEHNNQPLDFATLTFLESDISILTDEKGAFVVDSLCLNTYTIVLHHEGCDADTIYLLMNRNIDTIFYLEHHTEMLEEIVATATKVNDGTLQHQLLKPYQLQQLVGKDISQVLATLNGVRLLKTGSTINKPIVNGFYGDKITMVMNGTVLSSQDWGTEHAPEIDAGTIQQIEILKSSQTVEYTTQNIGATIVMESPMLNFNTPSKFGVYSAFQTNGLQSSVSTFYQKGFEKNYAFRTQVSFKKSADVHAPNYVMSNTAKQELNVLFQQKFRIKKINVQTFYSVLQQKNALLKAAHIGNIEDLKKAIQSDTPLVVEEQSFKINNPKQNTNHHIFDVKLLQPIVKNHFIDYRINFQSNRRKEFDIRRGGRSNIPALDMHLMTFLAKAVHHNERYLKLNWRWVQKNGLVYQYKNNTNQQNTGSFPIIPDYIQSNVAVFSIQEFYKKDFSIHFGGRYELNYLSVFTFKDKMPANYKYIFNTYNFTTTATWMKSFFDWQLGASISSKTPNISELHSNGLHHGTASIEYGNPNLKTENEFGISNSINLKAKKYFSFNVNHIFQYINNFIYQKPKEEFLLTIKGAFPVFQYQATSSLFNTINLNVQLKPIDFLELSAQANFIRAKDLKTKDYIIYIPADAYKFGIRFLGNSKLFKDMFFETNGTYTLKQKRTPSLIPDYKVAPNGYFLLNIQAGASIPIQNKHKLQLSIAIENVLNTTYRDYLNRFRYFTDEMGFNAVFRLNYYFN